MRELIIKQDVERKTSVRRKITIAAAALIGLGAACLFFHKIINDKPSLLLEQRMVLEAKVGNAPAKDSDSLVVWKDKIEEINEEIRKYNALGEPLKKD
jgi:hypothetical protein